MCLIFVHQGVIFTCLNAKSLPATSLRVGTAPADQDFEGATANGSDNNKIIGALRFIGLNYSRIESGSPGMPPSFSGSYFSMESWEGTVGSAVIESVDLSNDFKLNSFSLMIDLSGTRYTDEIELIGYNDNLEKVRVSFRPYVTGSYGTGSNRVAFNSESTDNIAGNLNFSGTDWANIDRIQVYANNIPMPFFYMLFDNFDFDEAQSAALPTLTSNSPASSIGVNSAQMGGNISDDGGATVTERGLVYSYSTNNPVINGDETDKKEIGSGSGAFSSTITDLSPNTTYYYRAYATNSVGTAYGNVVNFTTKDYDEDGNVTAASGVAEPVSLPSTADSYEEAVSLFDFTLSDGGTNDDLPLIVTDISMVVGGTSTSADRAKITYILSGPDEVKAEGVYDPSHNLLLFRDLKISVADGSSEVYTLQAFYNDNTGLTDGHTLIFNIEENYFIEVGKYGTQVGEITALNNGTGTKMEVEASRLVFSTQPGYTVSGVVLSSPPVVKAVDAFGNTDLDFIETITLTEASPGSLSGNSVSSIKGVASFNALTYFATADQESYTLYANDQDGVGTNFDLIESNSVVADVVATKMVFSTQPAPLSITSGESTAFTTVPQLAAVNKEGLVDTGYETPISLFILGGTGVKLQGSGDTDYNTNTVTVAGKNGVVSYSDLSITYTNESSDDELIKFAAYNTHFSAVFSDALTSVFPAAKVSSVLVPANATYVAGQSLDFTVNFDQALSINTSGGTPAIELTIGEETRSAAYIAGSGSSSLMFRYTVASGDRDTDGLSIKSLAANGGLLQSGSPGKAANLSLNNVGATIGVKVDAQGPEGYSVAMDQATYALNNHKEASFTISDGEIGASYTYSYSNPDFPGTVTGAGTITSASQQVSEIDISALKDGIINLSLVLTDSYNNKGKTAQAQSVKDTAPPSGYGINLYSDFTSYINKRLVKGVKFTGTDLVEKTTLTYKISSENGGEEITGSLEVSSVTQNIDNSGRGFDLSGLNEGLITFEFYLSDTYGNKGEVVSVQSIKDTEAPADYSFILDSELIGANTDYLFSFLLKVSEVEVQLEYALIQDEFETEPLVYDRKIILLNEERYSHSIKGSPDGETALIAVFTDKAGNESEFFLKSFLIDQTAPSGHELSFDQEMIGRENQTAASFTITNAEIGASYSYIISSDGGGENVTGSGTLTEAKTQLAGIDLSGLAEGKLSLSLVLTDKAENRSKAVEASINKRLNVAPVAREVYIYGEANVGEVLHGNYIYTDADMDRELASTFQWFRATDAEGTDASPIADQNRGVYTLTEEDRGYFVSFEVKPSDGQDEGESVRSKWFGLVKANQEIAFKEIPVQTYGGAMISLGAAQTDQNLEILYTAADPSIIAISGNQATILKAGSTEITASQAGDDLTNPAPSLIQTVVVNKAPLDIRVSLASKIYGAMDPAFEVQITGYQNEDNASALEGELSYTREEGEAVGAYAIKASGLSSANYELSYTAGSLSIAPAKLSIMVADQAKVYSESDPSNAVSYEGFRREDGAADLEGALEYTREEGEAVGTYAIKASGLSSANYELSYTAGSLSIAPAKLSIMVADQAKVYGESDPSNAVSYEGFQQEDGAADLEGALEYTREEGEVVGTYAIKASGLSSTNYELSYTAGSLSIAPAKLSIMVADQAKVYGESDPSNAVSYEGFRREDGAADLEGALEYTREEGEAVGAYASKASGLSSANYELSYTEGSLSIAPAKLSIIVADQAKVYGESDPSNAVSYEGLRREDGAADLEGALEYTREEGEAVGAYAIKASGLSSANYELSYETGVLEIAKAELTVIADAKTKVFGMSDPSLSYQLTGLQWDESATMISGDLQREAGEKVGQYAISQGSLSAGGNYNIAFTPALFTIEARIIEEVYPSGSLEADWGAELAELALPGTVLVRTENDELINLPVQWNTNGLNLRSRGTYAVSGKVLLSEGISTQEVPAASIEIVVKAKAAPKNILLTNNSFKADRKSSQIAIGSLEIVDDADDEHQLELVSGVADNSLFGIADGMLYWMSAAPLAGQTSFSIMVAVTDADGNRVEREFEISRLRISLKDIEIFNTFTPNGDGDNDTWQVPDLKYYSDVRVMIYERSGKRVFITYDATKGWDGNSEGKQMAPGSYFWVVETGETGEVRRGTLNLLRN
ncbi:hypothetical protein GCM10007049_01880 [Echinicola pacifica]|uniref:MBG domain-containing protein n=2 Tax=Echinicola pacifica TaxID=346377 RepID=A0A918PK25_9BACT|nr:hypothetical protein GCM10007049_01880 [Echinicola pacifica]